MLSRWIKDLPFSLVHLAFVLLWLYFSIYQPSWLSISGLVVVGVLAVHHYKGERSSLLGLALATLCFAALLALLYHLYTSTPTNEFDFATVVFLFLILKYKRLGRSYPDF